MNREVHLQFKPLDKVVAEIQWEATNPPTNIQIYIDNDQDGRIRCIIHELLHVVFDEIFEGKIDELLQEAAILAWEGILDTYVTDSPPRMKSWRLIIAKKLKEQEKIEDED